MSDRAPVVLRRGARMIPGADEYPSQFAPRPALWVDGREFAHVHGDHLEVRLTRPLIRDRRSELRSDARVSDIRSDWIAFAVRSQEDETEAMRLLQAAADANRRKPGEAHRKPPPDAVRNRRRLHRGTTEDVD